MDSTTSPCVRYQCHEQQRCASERLCCWSYAHWVSFGRSHHPAMRPDEIGKRAQMHSAPAPSREWYYEMMER